METNKIEMEIRSFDSEERVIRGIAVPYGQTIELGGFSERFERGAISSVEGVKLFWQHKEPIGRVTMGRETEAGFEIEAHISNTERGNEAYTLLKDGVIDKFSVGFIPVKTSRSGDTFIRESVTLKEVSLVAFPAYSGAAIQEVREASVTEVREAESNKENTHMENMNDYSAEIAELRDSVSDLGRKFDKVAERDSEPVVQYRSAGEWLQALAKGDGAAKEIATRDFGTTVEADVVRPAWINSQLKIVEKQRIVKNLFTTAPLPSTGNSIEYPFVKSTSGAVAQQVNEGDNLAYMEVALDTATAPVRTYGGYSSLSRQAIERSDLAYLESVLRFQTIQYANATEAAVQSALMSAAGTNSVERVGDTAAAWLGAVIDAKAEIDENSHGLSADFILISHDVHRELHLITDTTGRPMFTVNNDGVNTFGTLPAGRLAGVIDGTPVVVGKNLPAGTVVVASSQALVSYESAGAPFRLQDENIINLTKDFSLYGYLAIAIPDAKGITVVTEAA